MKWHKTLIIIALAAGVIYSCDNGSRSRRGQFREDIPSGSATDSAVAEQSTSIPEQPLAIKPVIQIFIENSGSMNGYVNGHTEFEGAIRDMRVLLKFHYDEDKIKLFCINNQIHDVTGFANNIQICPCCGVGNTQSTNLNQIFEMILNTTDNNTISILFSDCIYSIHGSNTAGLLQDEKSLTKDAFLTKWKKDQVPLATTIVKMKSQFDGRYYPYTGDKNAYRIKGERPYYICIIANQELLGDFNKNIELRADRVEGFENKYTLLSEKSKDLYYTVLQSTLNRGRFKPDRLKSKTNYIHGITDIALKSTGGGCSRGQAQPLQFAVAVDYSKVQAESDYLSNPTNYEVTTGNFTIKEVLPISEVILQANDKNRIAKDNPTHVVVLEAKTNLVSNVSFVLKKQMPEWITASTTEDDTSQERTAGKTFGLIYWVRGIAEAYQTIYPENKYYFECTITINNN